MNCKFINLFPPPRVSKIKLIPLIRSAEAKKKKKDEKRKKEKKAVTDFFRKSIVGANWDYRAYSGGGP